MSKAGKHTPAPWVFAPDYDENDGDIIIGGTYDETDGKTLIPDGPRVVAICFKSDLQDEEQYPTEEVRANAHLIAAAPELYIALLAIEEYILQEAGYGERTFNRALQNAALAALAKARGEMP